MAAVPVPVFENSQPGALVSSGANINLPQTTALGDCLFVAVSVAGTSGVTVSGAGATWVQVVSEGVGPQLICWVGYNCSAGNTTFKVTYPSGGPGTYVMGMWSNVQTSPSPVLSNTGATQGSPISPLTTSSASYTPGNLVIACCAGDDNTSWICPGLAALSSSFT